MTQSHGALMEPREATPLCILHLGVHELNAGWGAEMFLARAFERLGHRVIRIDYRAHRCELPQLLQSASEQHPDAVLLQRGEGVPAEWLSAFDAPKLYYATERASVREQQELLRSPVFDGYVAASQNTFQHMIRECHVPADRARWIPSGFDGETYRPLNVSATYNVIAVCGLNKRRRAAFRALGWEVRRKRMLSGIMGAECNELVNRSRVALNIHVSDIIDTETRLFELLPTNAVIVSEACDAPELFEGGGIQWFPPGDWAAMTRTVKALLTDQAWRSECVRKNHAIAPSHTWDARAASFITLIDQLRRRGSERG